jgi:hypothetical protein
MIGNDGLPELLVKLLRKGKELLRHVWKQEGN